VAQSRHNQPAAVIYVGGGLVYLTVSTGFPFSILEFLEMFILFLYPVCLNVLNGVSVIVRICFNFVLFLLESPLYSITALPSGEIPRNHCSLSVLCGATSSFLSSILVLCIRPDVTQTVVCSNCSGKFYTSQTVSRHGFADERPCAW